MKQLLIIGVCLLGWKAVSASGFSSAVGARATALGNHFTTLSDDVFSTGNNQAGIGFIKEFSAGVAAANKFSTAALNTFAATAVLPTKTGSFGLTFMYYGLDVYNEKKAGLAFGKAFGNRFSAGLQFDYIHIDMGHYGSRHLFTFEAGLQFYILPQLVIGAHVNNPLRLKIDKEGEDRYPTIMRFGLSYLPSAKVAIRGEVEKDLDFNPVYKLGIEYFVVEKFTLRGGFNAYPFNGFLGVGLKFKTLGIDAVAVYHQALGFSSSLSLSYVFRRAP